MRDLLSGSVSRAAVSDAPRLWRTRAVTILLYAIAVAALPTVVSGVILEEELHDSRSSWWFSTRWSS